MNEIKKWWNSLSQNERIAVGVTGLLAVVAVAYGISRRKGTSASASPQVRGATTLTGPRPTSAVGGYGYSPSGGVATSNDNALAIAQLNAKVAEDRIAAQERIARLQADYAYQYKYQQLAQQSSQAAARAFSPFSGGSGGTNTNKRSPFAPEPMRTGSKRKPWSSQDASDEELLLGIDDSLEKNPFGDLMAFFFPKKSEESSDIVPEGSVTSTESYSFVNPSSTALPGPYDPPPAPDWYRDFTLYEDYSQEPGYYVRVHDDGGSTDIGLGSDGYDDYTLYSEGE